MKIYPKVNIWLYISVLSDKALQWDYSLSTDMTHICTLYSDDRIYGGESLTVTVMQANA
jgi:hypothetical protein